MARTSFKRSGTVLSRSLNAAIGTAALGAAVFPLAALADGHKTLTDFINTATQIVGLAVPFGALLLLLFWSIMQLVMTTGDAEKKKQAKQRIIWGIIAIFVVFSIGGLVAAIQQTFFSDSSLQQPGQ